MYKRQDYDSVYVASGGTCTIDSNRAKINVVDGGSLNIGNNIGSVTVSGGNVSVVSTYAVYVNDQSIVSDTELTGRLLLIDDQSGRLNFEGITANNGGLWDATPVLNKETNQWYLSRIVKTANNDTKVLLFDAENSYAMWRNTADSLRSRLGELHGSAEHDNGIWARTQTCLLYTSPSPRDCS